MTTKQANKERVIGSETKRDRRIENMEKKKKKGGKRSRGAEEQQKEEQQALKRKEESWERKEAHEKKSRIEGTYNSGERKRGATGNKKEKKGGE